MFGVCWLPQQAFFLYTFHDARVLDTAHIQHVYLAFYWLAMANSMINPVIYYWMNARFRSYIREVVLGCVCLRCPRRRLSSYDGSPIPTRRNLNTHHHHHHHHHHPTGDDPSSRSRSDTRQGVNGTVRTFHGSRSNNHILVYSSRERLNIRNGRLVSGGGGGSGNSGGGGGSGGGGQCDMCLQTLRPTVLNDVGGGVGGGRGLDHTTTPGPNNLPLRTLNNHFQSPMTDLYKYRAVKYQSEF
ncbi:hypothetical protein Pmani_012617 [Petrolisthes manimaculis]|uniref:G-protein coupled receptors family 1 profile domain-containing protein n=1 Tax=Petrolisthes manimaculis TaxID=1843537 RepID=A0AAE1PXF4_9EUCA|nr:hypothetical protein Pmani_012617 [Petrolisthes manimaculis]